MQKKILNGFSLSNNVSLSSIIFSLRNLDIKCKKSNFSDFLGWKGFSFSIGRRSFDWRKSLSVGGAAPKLTKAQKTRTKVFNIFPLFERLAGYKNVSENSHPFSFNP